MRIFDEGKLIPEIIPEIWLFGNESFKIARPREEQTVADMRIISVKVDE